mmetsp:Transcript_19685/g.35587  ORF Transcript_19685/g.35587 Transcript_19685/m.35587 type:complete len:202 (-) Transcript_19685:139-744(-)
MSTERSSSKSLAKRAEAVVEILSAAVKQEFNAPKLERELCTRFTAVKVLNTQAQEAQQQQGIAVASGHAKAKARPGGQKAEKRNAAATSKGGLSDEPESLASLALKEDTVRAWFASLQFTCAYCAHLGPFSSASELYRHHGLEHYGKVISKSNAGLRRGGLPQPSRKSKISRSLLCGTTSSPSDWRATSATTGRADGEIQV